MPRPCTPLPTRPGHRKLCRQPPQVHEPINPVIGRPEDCLKASPTTIITRSLKPMLEAARLKVRGDAPMKETGWVVGLRDFYWNDPLMAVANGVILNS